MNKEYDTEHIWSEFWEHIIVNEEDGSINIKQLKKELRDFYFIIDQLPKVYEHVTGGRISKHMTYAESVIEAADDKFDQDYKTFLLDELKILYNNPEDMKERIEELEREVG